MSSAPMPRMTNKRNMLSVSKKVILSTVKVQKIEIGKQNKIIDIPKVERKADSKCHVNTHHTAMTENVANKPSEVSSANM